jgi:dihydrofolate synthase/folylpolyglutamate synthase
MNSLLQPNEAHAEHNAKPQQMSAALPGLAPTPDNHPANPILARLHHLYPKLIDLSLDRVLRLLAALGNPQLQLPPIIHVAGTNGKGSTCAFLRAIGEAAGLRVHVTTSPHLVRLNERFRIGGELVSDEALAAALLEIERVNAGAPITVFEVLVAAGYLLFSRTPADLCVVEVGLGGRYDATNVITPAACAIASISLDHQDFLGDRLDRIAWEKAGIMKPGRPAATGFQAPDAAAVLRATAQETGAHLLERGRAWDINPTDTGLRFSDEAGILNLPQASLPGVHQIENAGLAIAALRASGLPLPTQAYAGVAEAVWPARLQRLQGSLAALLPPGFELWLDGGHNEGAGLILAEQMRAWNDLPVHLIVGMKQGKNAAAFLHPLLPLAASVWAVREPGQHLAVDVDFIAQASCGAARPGPDVAGALRQLASHSPGRILICGSLYLAGEVLKSDMVS